LDQKSFFDLSAFGCCDIAAELSKNQSKLVNFVPISNGYLLIILGSPAVGTCLAASVYFMLITGLSLLDYR